MTRGLIGNALTDYHEDSWSSFLGLLVLTFSSVYIAFTPWAGSYGALIRFEYLTTGSRRFRKGVAMTMAAVFVAVMILLFVSTNNLNVSEEFQEGPQQPATVAYYVGGVLVNQTVYVPYGDANSLSEAEQIRRNYNAFRTYQTVSLVMLFIAYVVLLRWPHYTTEDDKGTSTVVASWWPKVFAATALLGAAVFACITCAAVSNYPGKSVLKHEQRAIFGFAMWLIFAACAAVHFVIVVVALSVYGLDVVMNPNRNIGARIGARNGDEEESPLMPPTGHSMSTNGASLRAL